jgi:hypothetical protein
MRAFINNFNLLEWPKKLAFDLEKAGLDVTIIDNNSTYLPLLKWYDTCHFKVIRLSHNAGHRSIWDCNLVDKRERYIYTDPDIDISGIPSDWLERLNWVLDEQGTKVKIGLALRIDDLPKNSQLGIWARRIQTYYWSSPLGDDLYEADVDTTIALYNPLFDLHQSVKPALRLGGKYAVRHMPWYLGHKDTWPEDFKYYYHTSNHSSMIVTHMKSFGTNKDCKWLP